MLCSQIAAPLTDLTSSKVTFTWNPKHQKVFDTLCQALMSPPILDCPTHDDHFVLMTDASDMGIGAILSTLRGTIVEYASRTLSLAERKYTTTEKECLAIVWAVRKFRHFCWVLHLRQKQITNHLSGYNRPKPVMLVLSIWKDGHWSCVHMISLWFIVQAKIIVMWTPCPDFQYHWYVALQAHMTIAEITKAQRSDPSLSLVIKALEDGDTSTTTEWKQFSLRRYQQIWRQLMLHETILCRQVKSPTMMEEKLLIVVPASLRKLFLSTAHDKAGHQGSDCSWHK